MTIPTVTVTGTFRTPAGDAATGTVTFKLNEDICDAVGNIVVERQTITSTLDAQGRITDTDGSTVGLVLYATSGGDITQTGLAYQVTKKITGSRYEQFTVALPSSPSTVDMADLLPVADGSATWAAVQPLDADLTAIAALSTATFGRSLLTQATAVAARSTLGVSASEVVNALDHGITGDGSTNDVTAINTLLTTLGEAGGGTVFFPEGTYRLTTASIRPRSNVSIVGAGIGKTIFKPVGAWAAFQTAGEWSVGNELTNCHFLDFEVDGSEQTGLVKAFFFQYIKRCTWTRVYVHDTGASGFGVDFLLDCHFTDCIAYNAGRNGTTSSPGCSGFGIGTGAYDVENVSLTNCTAKGNKRYGVFFEKLTGNVYNSKGARVIGGYYGDSNNRGIGDCGSRGLVVSGAQIVGNVGAGFFLGADQSDDAGYDGLVTGCYIAHNGGRGVDLDWTVGAQNGRYAIRGNRIIANTSVGVKVQMSGAVTRLVVADNEIADNGSIGVHLVGGTSTDLDVTDNRVMNNTGAGIGVACSSTRLRIARNRCGDTRSGGSRTQTYGLDFSGGNTITDGEIAENHFANNSTGGFNKAGTLTTTTVRDNVGYVTSASGATSVADGGTITHGLATTPTKVRATASTSGEFVSVTALGSSTFTVAIKKYDGTAGTTQTVYWQADV